MHHLIDYAKSFVGKPYKWGGSNPISGFDCSGFVQEILASAGEDPKGDQTAQGLYDYFSRMGQVNPQGERVAGSLIFFGKSFKEITHVAFAIDEYRMIEAGGGGLKINSLQGADSKNAFVRIRPIKSRGDFVSMIKPYYKNIGRYF